MFIEKTVHHHQLLDAPASILERMGHLCGHLPIYDLNSLWCTCTVVYVEIGVEGDN